MNKLTTDILIVGAGPVGLMCATLAQICGLKFEIIDKSKGPLEVGRADALNARTLQLLEIANLFDDLYPLGKICNTSSVWKNGKFISRESSWWEELEGCFHKHFLMLGQSYVEKLLDQKLLESNHPVRRSTSVDEIEISNECCTTQLSNGMVIESKFIIGADGSRSFVRENFNIPFNIHRPKLIWAVIDGVVDTDFPKVPEIISFQNETSDVAWIPREGNIDRFYVRMDVKEFTIDEALIKINKAVAPYKIAFKEIVWFSQFSVKESVAEKYSFQNKVFLAGDACHIHSVNGGQGLNTGIADAFNLIWKLNMVANGLAPISLLDSYENERKPVALQVVATSGELVRSTKFSSNQTHAQDYVKIVEKKSGYITGMGIKYGLGNIEGTRLFDFKIKQKNLCKRVYSMLNYNHYTLLIFGEPETKFEIPHFVKIIQIFDQEEKVNYTNQFWTSDSPYSNQAVLIRPDSYIEKVTSLDQINNIATQLNRKKAD